jgi:hypothetical protein
MAVNDEQKRINEAIDRGVTFLKSSQFDSGRWEQGGHAVGYAALPGLTLLECGVPAGDASVQRAATFVRQHAKTLEATYELALAILFLDRLGDSADRPLIQAMALRLIAGQNTTGGWTYHCPLLGVPDQQHLLAFLRRHQTQPLLDPLGHSGQTTVSLAKKPASAGDHPLGNAMPGPSSDPFRTEPLSPLSDLLRAPGPQRDLSPGSTGPGPATAPVNKLALGVLTPDPKVMPGDPKVVAQGASERKQPPKAPSRKEPPGNKPAKADPLPAHLKNLTVVHMNDGTVNPRVIKGKAKPRGMLRGVSGDNSNTQFAILALWVARRHGVPMERTLALVDHRFQSSQNIDGGWGYHYQGGDAGTRPSMTCVGLLGLAMGHGFAQETAADAKDKQEGIHAKERKQDPSIQRGLKKLGQYVGNASGIRRFAGQLDLYFLWSVERVGVLYNLKTIGNKDWYAWASQSLLATQEKNGSWWTRGYHGSSTTIDTCLALLILRRTNLVPDLTENLRMLAITDPDAASRASGR